MLPPETDENNWTPDMRLRVAVAFRARPLLHCDEVGVTRWVREREPRPRRGKDRCARATHVSGSNPREKVGAPGTVRPSLALVQRVARAAIGAGRADQRDGRVAVAGAVAVGVTVAEERADVVPVPLGVELHPEPRGAVGDVALLVQERAAHVRHRVVVVADPPDEPVLAAGSDHATRVEVAARRAVDLRVQAELDGRREVAAGGTIHGLVVVPREHRRDAVALGAAGEELDGAHVGRDVAVVDGAERAEGAGRGRGDALADEAEVAGRALAVVDALAGRGRRIATAVGRTGAVRVGAVRHAIRVVVEPVVAQVLGRRAVDALVVLAPLSLRAVRVRGAAGGRDADVAVLVAEAARAGVLAAGELVAHRLALGVGDALAVGLEHREDAVDAGRRGDAGLALEAVARVDRGLADAVGAAHLAAGAGRETDPAVAGVVAGVAGAVVVRVELVGVGRVRAIVAARLAHAVHRPALAHAVAVAIEIAHVARAVGVEVGLVRVGDEETVVTGVAEAVFVVVFLVRVLDADAVVHAVEVPVAVAVADRAEARTVGHAPDPVVEAGVGLLGAARASALDAAHVGDAIEGLDAVVRSRDAGALEGDHVPQARVEAGDAVLLVRAADAGVAGVAGGELAEVELQGAVLVADALLAVDHHEGASRDR